MAYNRWTHLKSGAKPRAHYGNCHCSHSKKENHNLNSKTQIILNHRFEIIPKSSQNCIEFTSNMIHNAFALSVWPKKVRVNPLYRFLAPFNWTERIVKSTLTILQTDAKSSSNHLEIIFKSPSLLNRLPLDWVPRLRNKHEKQWDTVWVLAWFSDFRWVASS